MARDWRMAVWAAFAAAAVAGACVLGAHAQAPDEPASETPHPQAGGKKRQDPADAQRAIETALKQLQAGRAEQAIQSMSATLAGGNLPPGIMAKAFYVRGMAHRRQGRPAQAVSDLTSALWLKGGLGGDERADAIKERSAAYADAGLGDPGEVAATAPKTASGGNWLSGLFGGSSAPTPPPSPPKVVAAPVERVETPPQTAPAAVPDGWSNRTQVEPSRAAAVAAAPAAPPPRAEAPAPRFEPPPSARPEGRYLVQLAAVRTEAEALALATKAKRELAAVLASREQSIDRAVIGNFGAFYRVRFGPFASAQETEAVCAKLLGSGLDCMSVGP